MDVVVTQLAAQYEQTNSLLATLTNPDTKTLLQTTNTTQIRPPKINLPTFDGSNPLDWLFQADQYFTLYNTPPPQRLSMIAFYLTGDALSWYKYLVNNRLLTTWSAFTRDLEIRFGPSSYDNHQAALFKLRQTATVTEYQTAFERISNCIVGLPPDALLNCFLSGLRPDIQQELTIQRPQSLTHAIFLAKLIEDKLTDQRSKNCSFSYRPAPPLPTTPPSNSLPTTTTSAPALLPAPSRSPPNIPFTRLSPDALQKRRATGLCFRCPDKYHPGHKCNPPQFLLIADNDEPDSPEPPDTLLSSNTPINDNPFTLTTNLLPDDPHHHFLSLSNAALLGLTSPKSVRITGHIHGHPVSILIDSGSIHNILQPQIVLFLNLPTQPIESFPVMIGDGKFLHCNGFCPDLHLHLPTTSFTLPFFILPIQGADVVLGMTWLSSLGEITADFSIP